VTQTIDAYGFTRTLTLTRNTYKVIAGLSKVILAASETEQVSNDGSRSRSFSSVRSDFTDGNEITDAMRSDGVITDAELAAAVALVEAGQFEAGARLLVGLAGRLHASRSEERARAYLYLGIAYIGLSQQERVRAAQPVRPGHQ
jgi:hypothetical protein